jgi:HKD family nuclease
MENMLKYESMKCRHRLLQFTSGTPYIPQKENKAYTFDHCTITLRSYFYPTSLTFGDAKYGKNPKCSFLLQNQQWNQRMNSHEPCI